MPALFTKSDTTLETALRACARTVSVVQNDTVLFSIPIRAPVPLPVLFTFPKEGSYEVVVFGTPATNESNSFAPFTLKFSYFVRSTDTTVGTISTNRLREWFPYVATLTSVWILLLWIDAVPLKKPTA